MSLKLAYMGLEATDLEAWRSFGSVIGFQIEDELDALVFRMDRKARRIVIRRSDSDDFAYCGWEAESVAAYEQVVKRLREGGVDVCDGDLAGAKVRGVSGYAAFSDPNGFRQEVAYGLREGATPFASEHLPGGFRTSDGGMGHILVKVPDYRASGDFAQRFLEGRISDYITAGAAEARTEMVFIHMNERHHSVAFFQGAIPANKKIHHFMVEVPSIEDVGRAHDRVQAAGIPITVSLGQHANDHEFSFYCATPGGFWMEVGAGGILIDDRTWQPAQYDRTSTWGHKFQLRALR